MSSKSIKFTVGILLVGVMAVAFGFGYRLGATPYLAADNQVLVVNEAWRIIYSDYVDQSKLDGQALSGAAIKAIVDKIDDPYMAYMSPRTYQLSLTQLEGSFDGIGAQVGIKDGRPQIAAVFAGSPAEKAGIKPGDVILEVDGKSTTGMTVTDVVLAIRGPRGTTVKLLVLHQGESTPTEIEVVRSKVEVTSVTHKMVRDYAYIKIEQFAERTDAEVSAALKDITEKSAKGIVLDLRGNPGGILRAVVDVTSRFLKDGNVVEVVSNRGRTTTDAVRPSDFKTDLPMVVLTDNWSASGSEVLSGALQDYARATIAGGKTFGKGSVNVSRQLSDGSGLHVTTARWHTPKGRPIEGKGIEPDVKLDLKGDAAIDWAIEYLQGKR